VLTRVVEKGGKTALTPFSTSTANSSQSGGFGRPRAAAWQGPQKFERYAGGDELTFDR